MRWLLDTHVLLWALGQPERLSAEIRTALRDPATDVRFSAASIWEIAIKSSLGRLDFIHDPEVVRAAAIASGFVELPVFGVHAAAVARLPPIHRDPFDRLLIAQAQIEPCVLVTRDPTLAAYPVQVKRVP